MRSKETFIARYLGATGAKRLRRRFFASKPDMETATIRYWATGNP
jgi:hypothetical protein